ncbi:hypothetical protein IEQ44_14900 [Nocardioides sp. Y6]|uniref:Uncharacterized protein n=1 Tax=Nocardioides malaquae TaxID=2773426 RepID=A0ABR9RXK9_9ACTN|nr:hypothetical protein [Nocardioides malaquae]MBE7325937.1 hypothetical protein [Nocardioides malaquae]
MPQTIVRPVVLILTTFALLLTGLTAPAGAEGSAVAAAETTAAAKKGKKTRCLKGSGASGGVCFKLRSTKYRVKRVESVPLRNKSSKKATMHCSFTKTISKSVQRKAGISSTAEVNAVFGLAKLNVSVNVEKSVTQTASQATTAGGSIVLKPGEEVTCIRTYGHVVTKVRRYAWSGNKMTSDEIIKTKIPSSLGVDIID